MVFCENCQDEFDPIEARDGFVDPDVPHFCSSECEDKFKDALELREVYDQANSGAPLW